MLLENAYVIDGIKLQESIMYDIKMMLYNHATYENAKKGGMDKEGAFRWYSKYKMALRRDLFWQGLDDAEIEMIVNYVLDLQDGFVHGAYKMYQL